MKLFGRAQRGGRLGMLAGAVMVLVACGGGPSPDASHVIGGTLSGITSGTLVLQNNAGDNLSLTADGRFSFATSIGTNRSYAITVLSQPLWQFCTVSNGSGTVAAEVANVSVHCVQAQATVSTLAGSGTPGTADGEGLAAQFGNPRGVRLDAAGHVYVADAQYRRVRKISASGTVTTLAGDGGAGGTLSDPFDLALDASGNIYLTELTANVVREITPGQGVNTVAGSGANSSVDGNGTSATFSQPSGIAFDAQGNLLVADSLGQKIRQITPNRDVSTLAGSGSQGTTDGTGTSATFSVPAGIAVDAEGNAFVTDFGSHIIRKITPQGVVTTLFGRPNQAGSADGPGNDARFSFPVGIAIDSSGSLYVADSATHVIRRITPDGMVSTLAGMAGSSGAQDGPGPAASFNRPYGVAVDASGNVYVADQFNHRIRKITPTPPP